MHYMSASSRGHRGAHESELRVCTRRASSAPEESGVQGYTPRSVGVQRGSPAERALVEAFLDPDWVERGALIGTLAEAEEKRVVALANYVRLRGQAAAEVAFVIADQLQCRGLGPRLLAQLAARAGAGGIERFVAEVMAGNRPMLDVFTGAGFEVVRELEGGEIEVRFRSHRPPAPTAIEATMVIASGPGTAGSPVDGSIR